MKTTTKTQPKNGQRSIAPTHTNGADVLEAESHDSSKEEVSNKIEKTIHRAFYYEDHDGICGIGFRVRDKALIEFKIRPVRDSWPSFDEKKHTDKITLSQALEWLEYMFYAAERFGYPCQEDYDGQDRWIGELRNAVG